MENWIIARRIAIKGILSADLSVKQQLQHGLQEYGLSVQEFDDTVELDIEDAYVTQQTRVEHIFEQDLNLEEKYLALAIKSYFANN